jgi:chorismate synthase
MGGVLDMLRYLSSGESHGRGLTAIIEGLPSNMPISIEAVDQMLFERQQGKGRGGRMRIEKDSVEVLSGIRGGYTLGSPMCLFIQNRDWDNWKNIMKAEGEVPAEGSLKRPRPGHADLAGAIKYNHRDIRNVLERASARETAIRTAVGAVAMQMISFFGIDVDSSVISVAGTLLPDGQNIRARQMEEAVRAAREAGDTVGGVLEVRVTGLPPGLGSYAHYDRRMDGRLAAALMSIQGIKGVEFGLGFKAAELFGSEVHDEIFYDNENGYFRKTNNAGGVEGGVTNGSPLTVRCALKPIPTLKKPVGSVDMDTKKAEKAGFERSDVCVLEAASVVAKAAAAWVIAVEFCEKFGGDSLGEMKANYKNYVEYIRTT